MDYLQYVKNQAFGSYYVESFKPCYKWITFNTLYTTNIYVVSIFSFKPCYKWITFNILTESIDAVFMVERSHFYMVAKTIHFSVF